jgi:hypothetical protein
MPKLTVIEGGRDRGLIREEKKLRGLVKAGASIRVESGALLELVKLGVRLAQLKSALSRCQVRGVEANAEFRPQILHVDVTILENPDDQGQQLTFRKFALKVVMEEPKKPGRVAVIDIGQLEASR